MRARIVLASALACVAASVLSVGETGCGSTGGKRFAFEARAGGIVRDSAPPYTFTNEHGWTVTLTRATVTMGPIYLNVVAPLRSPTAFFPFGVRAAHADTEHLGEGRRVGEVLAQLTFDALSPTLVPFPTAGTITQDQVRTAEIWFWPAPDTAPEATNIDTVAADVAGEAARGGETIRFRGQLVLNEAWAEGAEPGERSASPISAVREVRGIPTTFFPDEGGALEIRVDVSRLFRGADFANLRSNPTDENGTKLLVQAKTGQVTTDQVMRNVFQGLRASTGTYAVRWVPSGEAACAQAGAACP